jgi:multidrug efflux pump subunit AcrA (membrane-fusion protein)
VKSSLARVFTSRRTSMVWIGVAAVVVCGAGVATAVAGGSTPMLTQRATVARGTIDTTVPAVGTIAKAETVPLNFGATGLVESVDVRAGSHVRAGQVLATLDQGPAQAMVTEASQVLDQAESYARALVKHATSNGDPASDALIARDQAAIDSTRQQATELAHAANADRVTMAQACDTGGSHPTGTASACTQAEIKRLDDLTSYSLEAIRLTNTGDAYAGDVSQLPGEAPQVNPLQLGADQAAVARAQQALAEARRFFAQTTITAPADGTITAVHGTVGESVVEVDTSSGRVTPVNKAPTLAAPASGTAFVTFRPSDPSALIANVWVTSGGVQSVLQGETATVSFPGGQRAGTVIGIGPTASKVQGQWAYPVTLWLGTGGPKPAAGTAVTAQITTAVRPNVLYVPRGAVSNHHGQHQVTVVEGTTTRVVPVWVGYHGSRFTEIIAGLTPGQIVLNKVPANNPSDAPTY